jgi:hypothetical protein
MSGIVTGLLWNIHQTPYVYRMKLEDSLDALVRLCYES